MHHKTAQSNSKTASRVSAAAIRMVLPLLQITTICRQSHPALHRSLGTLVSSLMGSPPALQQEGSSSIPDRLVAPPAQQQQQQHQHGCELPPPPPSLCGEPKNKLSLHRRGNRRSSYYARRKELFAHCKFCGQTGMPHEFLAVNQACTGQCMQAPSKQYPKEYRPPV